MNINSNKGTCQPVPRGVSAKTSSPSNDRVVLLPLEVVTLIDDYRGFQRKSAEGYIGLGKTVWTAGDTLSRDQLRQFCDEVGLELEGDHYRRLSRVGQNADRLQAVIDKIPDKPTTIDWMARIPQDQFDIVLPHLTPESKMRELLAVLPAGSKKKRARRKIAISAASQSPAWLIEFPDALDEITMSNVQEELTKVIERFGLSMKPIAPIAPLLSQ